MSHGEGTGRLRIGRGMMTEPGVATVGAGRMSGAGARTGRGRERTRTGEEGETETGGEAGETGAAIWTEKEIGTEAGTGTEAGSGSMTGVATETETSAVPKAVTRECGAPVLGDTATMMAMAPLQRGTAELFRTLQHIVCRLYLAKLAGAVRLRRSLKNSRIS